MVREEKEWSLLEGHTAFQGMQAGGAGIGASQEEKGRRHSKLGKPPLRGHAGARHV